MAVRVSPLLEKCTRPASKSRSHCGGTRDRTRKVMKDFRKKNMTQIPRTCVLVTGLDANSKMGKALLGLVPKETRQSIKERRELCHRSAFDSDGMVRSTSTAERPRRGGATNQESGESHLVKCMCDPGFADQPKRQAKGNIKHAETLQQLVREKQIFLSSLPSDRPLTEKESEQRKMVMKKVRTNR